MNTSHLTAYYSVANNSPTLLFFLLLLFYG